MYNRVNMHNQAVLELRIIVEIYEKLNWFEIICEIFDEDRPYSPNKSW